MKVYERYQDIPESTPPSVVTIGVFDGLHVGHQALLQRVMEESRARSLWPAALTFHPHPARALSPGKSLPLLMPDLFKVQGLSSFELRFVLRQDFDAGFAGLSSDEFSRVVLAERINARLVVVGDDFAFGRNREGNIRSLRAFGERDGYEVLAIPRLQAGGATVSSTRIRALLAEGDLHPVEALLGRPFVLSGRVVSGRQRGRKLGFPTANLRPDEMMLPAPGIYAGQAWVEGEKSPFVSAINIGFVPTFGPAELTVEPHLIDFHGEILGKRIALALWERLRNEAKFPSAAALVAQIQKDVEATRALARTHKMAAALPLLDGDRLNEPVYPKR